MRLTIVAILLAVVAIGIYSAPTNNKKFNNLQNFTQYQSFGQVDDNFVLVENDEIKWKFNKDKKIQNIPVTYNYLDEVQGENFKTALDSFAEKKNLDKPSVFFNFNRKEGFSWNHSNLYLFIRDLIGS